MCVTKKMHRVSKTTSGVHTFGHFHVEHLQTTIYTLYFSYRKPLLEQLFIDTNK